MRQKGDVKEIVVVGAGLVGSLLSIFLAKRGYSVKVFDGRPDMRVSKIGGGRSINLALSNRGWLPLKKAGLEEDVKKMITPMHGRMMHDEDSKLTFQPYGKESQAINSISRSGLNAALMDHAEKAGVEILFEHSCEGVDLDRTEAYFQHNGNRKAVSADIIFGADGAFSAVRGAMQITDRFDYRQDYIPHGYKELSFPPGPNGSFLIEENALHIWPRRSFMLIALPNKDASFTVTLFLAFSGHEDSFENLITPAARQDFFHRHFPDALELMDSLEQEWEQNPTSSLVTIRCSPWVRGNTLLIGDAAHAVVPFYGQGMNCGFEDCRVLNDILDECNDDWNVAKKQYQEQRKKNGDAIADLALDNFIEMRDLVADPLFLIRKKIEAKLHELFPTTWIPQYSMVTFNEHISYSDAQSIGAKQRAIMDKVMSQPGIETTWESLNLQEVVDQLET